MRKNLQIFFITGASSAGKTSIVPYLKSILQTNRYSVHDFDEIGVPDNVTNAWRINETHKWIEQGLENLKKGISTVICGLTQPDEAEKSPLYNKDVVGFCLLDVSSEQIKKRLAKRLTSPKMVEDVLRVANQTPQEIIEESVGYAHFIKDLCKRYKAHVIQTSDLTSQEVAKKVVAWIETTAKS